MYRRWGRWWNIGVGCSEWWVLWGLLVVNFFFNYLISYFIFMCMSICLRLCHSVPAEAKRGCHIHWKLSWRQLLNAMWVLGPNPGPVQEQLVILTTELGRFWIWTRNHHTKTCELCRLGSARGNVAQESKLEMIEVQCH